jgi:hypothetical protein
MVDKYTICLYATVSSLQLTRYSRTGKESTSTVCHALQLSACFLQQRLLRHKAHYRTSELAVASIIRRCQYAHDSWFGRYDD